jgi:hypothetical protein
MILKFSQEEDGRHHSTLRASKRGRDESHFRTWVSIYNFCLAAFYRNDSDSKEALPRLSFS